MARAGKGTDCYKVLGVSRTASARTIRKAYRQLAKVYHPDVTKLDEEVAEERFIAIVKAYKVLKDPQSRAKYDRMMGYDRPPVAAAGPREPIEFDGGYTWVWDSRALKYRRVRQDLGSDTRWVESPYSFMERRRKQRREVEGGPGPLKRLGFRLWVYARRAARFGRRHLSPSKVRKKLDKTFSRIFRGKKRPPHKIKVARRTPPGT